MVVAKRKSLCHLDDEAHEEDGKEVKSTEEIALMVIHSLISCDLTRISFCLGLLRGRKGTSRLAVPSTRDSVSALASESSFGKPKHRKQGVPSSTTQEASKDKPINLWPWRCEKTVVATSSD